MKTLDQWFSEYAVSHQNPKNKFICFNQLNIFVVGISILLLLSIISCNSLKNENIKGLYKYNSKISHGTFSILDSVFEYKYDAPLLSYSSKGVWMLKDNRLVLKSYDNFKDDYIIVEENINQSGGYINVVDANGRPISYVNIKIDGVNSVSGTDENGRLNLNNLHPKKIEVFYTGLSEIDNTYITKSDKSNIFTIVIIEKNDNTRFFNGKFKIYKNKVFIDKQKFLKKIVASE